MNWVFNSVWNTILLRDDKLWLAQMEGNLQIDIQKLNHTLRTYNLEIHLGKSKEMDFKGKHQTV